MLRKLLITALLMAVILTVSVPLHARGQAATGTLCVIVYEDLNRNGIRDAGEPNVPDVNVSLSINPGVMVANDITPAGNAYCFNNLPAQTQYTLSANSPYFEVEDSAPFAFMLAAGEAKTRSLGLIRRPDTAARDLPLAIPLTPQNRLLLSALCAGLVMLTMIGVGLVMYGLIFAPRRPKQVDSAA